MCKIKSILLLILINVLGGCSVMSNSTVIPEKGPTLNEVYYNKLKASQIGELEQVRAELQPAHAGPLTGYTRTAKNELDSQFKRLPNPDLVMFVYPHLAGSEQTPVPGYSTTFPLYASQHYALPGER